MNDPKRQFAILLLLSVLWSPVNMFVTLATRTDISPAALGLIRWVCMSLAFLAALRFKRFREWTRYIAPTPRDGLLSALVGVFCLAPAHLLYYTSLRYTSSTEGVILLTSGPLWTSLLAWFVLREKIPVNRGLGIALGSIGAYVVSVGFGLPSLQEGHTIGNLMFLGGVLLESSGLILLTKMVRRGSGVGVLACQIPGAVVTFALASLLLPAITPFEVHALSPIVIAALFYMVFVAGMFCFTTWFIIVERAPIAFMMLSTLIQPVIAAVLGWLVLGEKMEAQLVVGTGLIFVALFVGVSSAKPKSRQESI